MKIYDGHIHTHGRKCDSPSVFLEKALSSGICGGTIFSVHPANYRHFDDYDQRAYSRIDWIMEYTSHTPGFIPYFFVDLSEPDVLKQIEYARKAGIRGYKVICDGNYSVGDKLEAVQAIAETKLPVMFHSGVDNIPHLSSRNNHPMSFECLMKVKGLRFSLAHLAWPWCDDYIGIFGKIEMARGGFGAENFGEMFVDTTPGTPGIYRRDALQKLYLTGYDAIGHTFWGTDQILNDYVPEWTINGIRRDTIILEEIEKMSHDNPLFYPDASNIVEPYFSGVWEKFNKVGE